MKHALELLGVTVRLGGMPVVRNLSFSIPHGGCFAIVGPNGSGKSTLIRAIMGLVPLSSGGIVLNGRRIESLTTAERTKLGLGVCLEGRRLFADLSVDDNLRAATLQMPRRDRGPALEQAYSQFRRLDERRRQRSGALSGGEQQMLALARVFIRKPKVLLLDEPSLGLAPWLAQEILSHVWRLPEHGTTVVVTEQNTAILPDPFMPACRVENGSVAAVGRLGHILENGACESPAEERPR